MSENSDIELSGPIVINGKRYPMWEQFVHKKNQFVGRIIQERDTITGIESGVIADVVLRANGKESAWFAFVDESGDELGGDVRYLSVGASGKPGQLEIHSQFGMSWIIDGPEPELA